MIDNKKLSGLIDKRLSIIGFDTIDSTSSYARSAFDSHAGSFVVAADRQTAGRGRQGRDFNSEYGGVYFTLALAKAELPRNIQLATPAAAVAVREALSELYGIEFGIKWVNDIYFGGKKIAGILSEALRGADGAVKGVLVGIGINILDRSFPPELTKAAAVSRFSERTVEPEIIIAGIINRLCRAFNMSDDRLIRDYRAHNIVIGHRISFEYSGKQMVGLAADIAGGGELAVDTASGRILLSSNDISINFID